MNRQTIMIRAENLQRNLALGSQSIEILKGISFEVARGETIALTGPSGSGKSTLLGLLAGIDSPTSGKLTLDSHDITYMTEHELARIRNEKIGIVFQSFNLIPTLTALENVEIPLYIRMSAKEARERAKAMLAEVNLDDRFGHRPYQLSGGQQQRVAIARALVTEPVILLADEPTGNLDSKNGAQILELFSKLRQKIDITTVIVTHDPKTAQYADRVLHLVDGKLVSTQATKGVLS